MTAKVEAIATLLPMGFIISGPGEMAWVNEERQINRKRNTLARRNGFEADDYSVMRVFTKGWQMPEGATPAQKARMAYKRLPLIGWDASYELQVTEGARFGEAYLRHELRSLEKAVTDLGVKLHYRDDGSFARAELP